MWLGSTPWVFYAEAGVHPKEGYGRPGWLPRQQFGSGPLSLTGQHYIDCAAWGMNVEYTGPVSVEGVGEFPKKGLFDVETSFMTIAEYQNGIRCVMSSFHPAGVRYEGDEGWIYAGPGQMRVTASDPHAGTSKLLDSSDRKILDSEIKENEIHLARVESMHGNWLDCIKTREQTIVPVEVAHRSCSLCLIGHIANKTGRRLYWDPAGERFIDDDEANSMLSRSQRYPYGTDYIEF